MHFDLVDLRLFINALDAGNITAGAERCGTALAMGNTGVFLVLFGTPLVASALVTHWGWGTLWLACALCGLAAAGLFPRVVRASLAKEAASR
jgi:MFS family permease